MRSSVIWSFLSVVALSTGALMAGCDSDAKIAKSGAGESCDSSADCDDGLNCLQGACYAKAPTPDGGAGEGSGGSMVGPTPPVLGGENESCTKAADCAEGLGCFNQRCIKAPAGEGGEGNIPGGPTLGQLGETCTVSADCDPSLACLPGGQQPGVPVGFLGVCSRPQGRLVPSGKSCGAECLEDADCAELPVALHIAYSAVSVPGVSEPYGTGANSCSELIDLIGAAKCNAAATGALAARCFAQAAYCKGQDAWTCEAGKCSYTADCKEDGAVVGGCPNFTRSGLAAYPLCDTDAQKCQPAATDPLCSKDSDCETLAIADLPGEVCTPDECVCYEKTACYRACDNTLDCRPGFVCDDDARLCVPAPACADDSECVAKNGPRSACIEEMCQTTCATDFDCNGGAFNGVNTMVCNAKGYCEALGCTSDEQCTNGAEVNPVRTFCTDNAAPAPGGVASAITD